MRILIALTLIIMLTSIADACQQCGRSSCNSCSTVRKIDTPDVFVVQNNYPQPITGQGFSRYYAKESLQSGILPFFDPNRYLSQRMELLRAMQAGLPIESANADRLAETFMLTQSATFNKIAIGSNQQQQSQAVVISRNDEGKLEIFELSDPQIEQLNQGENPLDQTNTEIHTGVVKRFCGKCHGLDVAEPKKELYIGDDVLVAATMKDRWYTISSRLKNRTMPPETALQPSEKERQQIANELRAIIENY